VDAARSCRVSAGFPTGRLGSDLFQLYRFRGRRLGGLLFRFCAAAFAINGDASSSAKGLASSGWASTPPLMESCPTRPSFKMRRACRCHYPHQQHVRSPPRAAASTMENKKHDSEASTGGRRRTRGRAGCRSPSIWRGCCTPTGWHAIARGTCTFLAAAGGLTTARCLSHRCLVASRRGAPRSGAGGGTYRRTSALIPPSPSTQIPSTARA
jgi:hypothetical protein